MRAVIGLLPLSAGAAVAALVTGITNIICKSLEKKADTRKLIFEKALDIEIKRLEFVKEIAKETGQGAIFRDPAITVEKTFSWLLYLYKYGELPDDAKETESYKPIHRGE